MEPINNKQKQPETIMAKPICNIGSKVTDSEEEEVIAIFVVT